MSLPASKIPVFISHSSTDKSAVRAISRYLASKGWQPWIDESGIAGGEHWHGALMNALESSRVVLLVVSISSMRSRWVIREIQAADRLGKPIIPVVVDDAPHPDELRLTLSGVQKLYLTERHDSSSRDGQLSRLDDALIKAAIPGPARPQGWTLTIVGTVIAATGIVGMVVGFALFAYLAASSVGDFTPRRGIPAPFYGWGLAAVSMLVTVVGASLRQAGRKRSI